MDCRGADAPRNDRDHGSVPLSPLERRAFPRSSGALAANEPVTCRGADAPRNDGDHGTVRLSPLERRPRREGCWRCFDEKISTPYTVQVS